MARSSLQLVLDQRTPLTLENKNGRQLLRKVIRHLEGVLGGCIDASHLLISVDGAQPIAASGSVTCAAVVVGDSFSLNGLALTATEARANCTVTCASVSDADTVTVNGKVFTAKTTVVDATVQFDRSGTDAATALDLVRVINANTTVHTSGIIEAVRPAANGVVNIYAIATGSAGNSYTIATSNGSRLAITNDSGGVFAGGTTLTSNQFDPMGNDIRTATEIARATLASGSALISSHVEASNWAGSVTLSTCLAGTVINIAGHEFVATAGTNAANQASAGDFTIAGTDTADATALKVAINAHPVLSHLVVATSSSGVVTIRQRRGTAAIGLIRIYGISGVAPSGATATTQFVATSVVLVSALHEGQSGNGITTASSNGTRLAITGAAARLLGGTGSASGTQVRVIMSATNG